MTLEVERWAPAPTRSRARLIERRPGDPLTLAELEQVDPSALWRRLVDLPAQMGHAWELGTSWTGPVADVGRIVVVGMGGSAIGAQLAARIVQQRAPVAIEVCRDSCLPATDERTLQIFCSFSGETDEVLTAFRSSLTRPGTKLAITRGGALAREASAAGVPIVRYEYEGEPRSALGYGTMLLLGVLHRLGIFAASEEEIDRTLAEVRDCGAAHHPELPLSANPARMLALEIGDAIPAIFADASLSGAAVRWQNQCNENSKRWAISGTLPEAMHNVVEGMPPRMSRGRNTPFHAVLLEDASRTRAERARMVAFQECLTAARVPSTRLSFEGTSDLSILLQACLVGDWVSYYLALNARTDPSPVPTITGLKQKLAQRAVAE